MGNRNAFEVILEHDLLITLKNAFSTGWGIFPLLFFSTGSFRLARWASQFCMSNNFCVVGRNEDNVFQKSEQPAFDIRSSEGDDRFQVRFLLFATPRAWPHNGAVGEVCVVLLSPASPIVHRTFSIGVVLFALDLYPSLRLVQQPKWLPASSLI
jgi:hypothetical protein